MDPLGKAHHRLKILVIAFTVAFIAIGTRIYWLTFHQEPFSRQKKAEIIRGPILDRRGLALAITEEASTIGIAPEAIVDPVFTAETLARYLDLSSEEILQQFYINKNRKYFLLRRQLDNVIADQIIDLNLPGVRKEPEFRRVYPAESLASNLLGFVGRDQSQALDGLERIFNDRLLSPEKAAPGRGPAMVLSIDSLIQYRLEKVLGSAYEDSGSKRAVGLFMDINTGEILAMANFPNFDPNQYYRSSPFQRNNWALRFNYEPGSTAKVFMAAMLVNENLVKEDERFFCSGEIHTRYNTIRCKSGNRILRHGSLTLAEIIERSCNVGIIKAMQKINNDRFYKYLKLFEFGEKTGVLPEGRLETTGYLPDLKNWVPSSPYYYPIGQGFSVTPLQLLRAGAALAGKGNIRTPILVQEIRESSGTVLYKSQNTVKSVGIRPATLEKVQRMMALVVQKGTGRRAHHNKIEIIGKTGTGQKSSAQGYSEKYVVSFLGFFPASNPEYAGLILFDEPEHNHAGGTLAAPVFRDFAASIFQLVSRGASIKPVEKLEPIKARSPRQHRKGTLPDFRGLSASEALTAAAEEGIQLELKGSGFVFKQEPGPGTNLAKAKKIVLYLDQVD